MVVETVLVANGGYFWVGISRVYLGAHYPQDVVGGWTFGVVMLMIAITIIKEVRNQSLIANPVPLAFVSIFVGGMVPVLFPREFTIQMGGLFGGVTAGLILVRYCLPFSPIATPGQHVAKVAVGLGGLWLLRNGLLSVMPDGALSNWLLYLLMGWWIGGGVSWCAVRMGWQVEKPASGLETG